MVQADKGHAEGGKDRLFGLLREPYIPNPKLDGSGCWGLDLWNVSAIIVGAVCRTHERLDGVQAVSFRAGLGVCLTCHRVTEPERAILVLGRREVDMSRPPICSKAHNPTS